MSEVERYMPYASGYSECYMCDRKDGDWVSFEDYAALQQKLDAVLAENVDLRDAGKSAVQHWAAADTGSMERLMDKCMPALRDACNFTPATDAILNEVRAEAIAAVPTVCDGKEQTAFEDYARSKGLDLSQHPLHYLFLDGKTNQARSAWRECLVYVAAQLRAGSTEGGV